MKRIFTIIAVAAAAIGFTSCNPMEKDEDITSYYKIIPKSNTDHVTLINGGSFISEFYPRTSDAGVDTDIIISFKADPSLASGYTAEKALPLPEANFMFIKSQTMIPAMYRYDLSGNETCKLIISYTDALAPGTVYVLPVVIEGISGNGKALIAKDDVLYITIKTDE